MRIRVYTIQKWMQREYDEKKNTAEERERREPNGLSLILI